MRSIINLVLAAACVSLIVMAGSRKQDSERAPLSTLVKTPDYSEDTLRQAASTNSKVLLVFSAKWCIWCQKFEHDVLSLSRVAERLKSRSWVVSKVDYDVRKDLAFQYSVKSLPTMVLVDSQGREIKRGTGYMGVREFIGWID